MPGRNPALVPLSHDHHHGLVLALRLQQGQAAQRDVLLKFFEGDLRVHFACEEEVLFPAVVDAVPGGLSLISRLLEDHRVLAHLISGIKGLPLDSLQSRLASVGELLESHIRAEERLLFPLCEQHLPATVLERLRGDMEGLRGRLGVRTEPSESVHTSSAREGGIVGNSISDNTTVRDPQKKGGDSTVNIMPAILLVEDEPELRVLFSILLENEGIQVFQAATGDEALAQLQSQGKAIQLVITDMNLPGADGTAVVSWARKHASGAKILAMSGYGGPDLQRAASESGADEFLSKPFHPEAAVAVVKRLLELP